MTNKDNHSLPTVNLVDLLEIIDKEVKANRAKNPKKEIRIEDLPTVAEMMKDLYSPGTILEVKYPEKEIIFSNPLSPIKSLQVNICSTETDKKLLYHKLHTLTRTA